MLNKVNRREKPWVTEHVPDLCDDTRDSKKGGGMKHGWIDDLQFYVLFNSISVISGRYSDDNERLCAMEHRLRLRRFHL